jgi:glycosyltransferase involved in cell wall biosynthesis
MVLHGSYPVGESRATRQARAAVDAGWEVDVVALKRLGEPHRASVDGAEVFRLPLRHQRAAQFGHVLVEYLGFLGLAIPYVAWRSLRRRYDVIQVHNPPDFLVICGLLPQLFGTRILLDIHDLQTDMFEMRFGDRRWGAALLRAVRRNEQWAALRADRILTVHEPYRRELTRRGVDPQRIDVVLNSLDEALLPTLATAGNGGIRRIVYHGSVTPHYGVDLLVRAFAQVAARDHSLRLEIYGDGDALPLAIRRSEELALTERVLFSGIFEPQRTVLEKVAGAAVGVIANLPIPRNDFIVPQKLYEYAALGVPIVAADLPAMREYWSEDTVRYFRAGEVASLAEALQDTFDHPDATATRVSAARARYAELAWSGEAEKYRGLLLRLIAPLADVQSLRQDAAA